MNKINKQSMPQTIQAMEPESMVLFLQRLPQLNLAFKKIDQHWIESTRQLIIERKTIDHSCQDCACNSIKAQPFIEIDTTRLDDVLLEIQDCGFSIQAYSFCPQSHTKTATIFGPENIAIVLKDKESSAW